MNIPIFITHWTKLSERKQKLIERMNEEGLSGTFIEKYDSQDLDLDSELCSKFGNHLKYNTGFKGKTVISLFLKHIECYRLMIEKNIPLLLILEDDALLDDNFKSKFDNYVKQLPDNWNCLCIGNGCKLHINSDRFKELKPPNVYLKSTKKIYGEGVGLFRCTDSYLINLKTAKEIYEHFQKLPMNGHKIGDGIDIWLNKFSSSMNYNIYWSEPTIVSQGSQNGTFLSTINVNYSDIVKYQNKTKNKVNNNITQEDVYRKIFNGQDISFN